MGNHFFTTSTFFFPPHHNTVSFQQANHVLLLHFSLFLSPCSAWVLIHLVLLFTKLPSPPIVHSHLSPSSSVVSMRVLSECKGCDCELITACFLDFMVLRYIYIYISVRSDIRLCLIASSILKANYHSLLLIFQT